MWFLPAQSWASGRRPQRIGATVATTEHNRSYATYRGPFLTRPMANSAFHASLIFPMLSGIRGRFGFAV
jgi:hypothetical protein